MPIAQPIGHSLVIHTSNYSYGLRVHVTVDKCGSSQHYYRQGKIIDESCQASSKLAETQVNVFITTQVAAGK